MSQYLLLSGITLLAMASPGPDMLLLLRNGMLGGVRVGLATVVGISLGVLIHVSLATLGLAWLITQNVLIYQVVKLLGAGYLIYIGCKAFRSSGKVVLSVNTESEQKRAMEGLRDGFLTNLLNPKVTIFVFSIFTQFIGPEDSTAAKMGCGAVIVLTGLVGWSAFVFAIQSRPFRSAVERMGSAFDRALGSILIGLGVSVAFATD